MMYRERKRLKLTP